MQEPKNTPSQVFESLDPENPPVEKSTGRFAGGRDLEPNKDQSINANG